MSFLSADRAALERYLPGLDAALQSMELLQMESPESQAIAAFQKAGGAGLLIPKQFGGREATPPDAIRVQRALASRSPSLAVATTMHQFSVATLLPVCTAGSGMEWVMLQAIAKQNLILASGFAEGSSGQNALKPTMQGVKVEQGIRVTGSKKPCSLSRSMSLLVASILVPDASTGSAQFAVALIPAGSPGMTRHSFWNNVLLNGAESDELRLEDVFVPDRLVFYPRQDIREESDEASGFLWFELMIAASYVGVASGLVERVIASGRGSAQDRVQAAGELENAMAALDSVARGLGEGQCRSADLARALFVRYSVQDAIERSCARAFEMTGGMRFASSSETAYLFAAARALAFHPPAKMAAVNELDGFLKGDRFTLN